MNRPLLRMNERGSAGPGLIAGLVVLAAVAFVCIQLIPIYYDHWTFEDEFTNEKLNLVWVNINDDKKVKDAVTQQAKKLLTEMNAQFKDKDIKVTAEPSKRKITVDVRYARPHKVPFLKNPLTFHTHKENTPI